jgi:hypothetical protein
MLTGENPMTNLDNIMLDSVRYRMLRDLYRLDPNITPGTARTMQEVFAMAGERRAPEAKRGRR